MIVEACILMFTHFELLFVSACITARVKSPGHLDSDVFTVRCLQRDIAAVQLLYLEQTGLHTGVKQQWETLQKVTPWLVGNGSCNF